MNLYGHAWSLDKHHYNKPSRKQMALLVSFMDTDKFLFMVCFTSLNISLYDKCFFLFKPYFISERDHGRSHYVCAFKVFRFEF